MAAMCDIAFLLLIFFILSAKPKKWEPVKSNLPYSTLISIRDMNSGLAEIKFGEGKLYFEMPDEQTSEQTLLQIGIKYHIPFSPVERMKLRKIDFIGVPISELKQYINGYYNDYDFFNQPGIPFATKNPELANWIYESKVAYKAIHDKDLSFLIIADEKLPYPQFKYIVDVLQSQNIDKFSLATNLKNH